MALILPIQGLFFFGSDWTYGLKYLLIAILWLLAIVCWHPRWRLPKIFWGLLGICLGYAAGGGITALPAVGWDVSYLQTILPAAAISLAPLALLLLVRSEDPMDRVRRIVLSLTWGITFALVISWVYFFTRAGWLIPGDFSNLSSRLYGVIKGSSATAVFSFSVILLSLWALYRSWLSHKVALCLELLGFCSLFATLSKSSILAAVPAIVALLFAGAGGELREVRKRPHLLTMALFGLFIAFAGIAWKQHWGIGEKPATWTRFNPDAPALGVLRIRPDISKTGRRLELWRAGIEVWRENWVLGIGMPNWGAELEKRGVVWRTTFSSPHNGLIEVAGGMGLFGLFLYLTVPLLLIWEGRRLPGPERTIFFALFVFTYIRELVATSTVFTFSLNGLLFWLMVGLLFAAERRAERCVPPTTQD